MGVKMEIYTTKMQEGWFAEVIIDTATEKAVVLHQTPFCDTEEIAIEDAQEWMEDNGYDPNS